MATLRFTAEERPALLAKAIKATVGPMKGATAQVEDLAGAMNLLDLADALLDGRPKDFDALLAGGWQDVALEAAGLGTTARKADDEG